MKEQRPFTVNIHLRFSAFLSFSGKLCVKKSRHKDDQSLKNEKPYAPPFLDLFSGLSLTQGHATKSRNWMQLEIILCFDWETIQFYNYSTIIEPRFSRICPILWYFLTCWNIGKAVFDGNCDGNNWSDYLLRI